MALDWDKLRVFHAVAEAGSFTHAGQTLKLSQSAISRQISALEESLSVPLFHRHARGLIMTEQGERLYATVHEVFGKLAATERALTDSKAAPVGTLRITCTLALATSWLAPRIQAFIDRYPEIRVTVIADDGDVDLGMGEADCAVRLGQPQQGDLVRRKLMTVHTHVYAARPYLDRYGAPERPEDLDRHRMIAYGFSRRPPVNDINWALYVGRDDTQPRTPVLEINNIYAIGRAVASGIGIAGLPDFITESVSGLVRVLPTIDGPSYDAYFVYPSELRNSARLQVFRDFLLSRIPETPF
ncbi:MAG: LysR family transcriptional regulator [Alphaproteobacteria bacterium]